MPPLRDEIIGRCIGDVAEALQRAWTLYEPTDRERDAVCRQLALAFLPQPVTPKDKDPLSLNLTDLYAIRYRGKAADALIDMFEDRGWRSRPSRPISDFLKVAREAQAIRAWAYLKDLE